MDIKIEKNYGTYKLFLILLISIYYCAIIKFKMQYIRTFLNIFLLIKNNSPIFQLYRNFLKWTQKASCC